MGHRINASTKMGFSFLFAEGWLEFGPSIEDVDPAAFGWSRDDGGWKNCSAWYDRMSSLDLPSSRVLLPSLLPSLLPLWFCAAGAAQCFDASTACPVSSNSSDLAPPRVSRDPSVTATEGASQFIACPGSGTSPLLPLMLGPAFSGSDALGLDQFSAWPAIPFRGSSDIAPRFSGSLQRGACQAVAAVRMSSPPSPCAPAPFVSEVRALGQDEQSLAPHGISGFGRTEYSCRNAVAQSLQWRDDSFKLSVRVPRHVFAEDKIRPALAGDADDLWGKKSLSFGPSPLSGNAVVLAWVARSEDMNESTPRASVEGEKVRPDRRWMKPPAFHRRNQACGGCGFPLHVADAASMFTAQSESEGNSEFKPTDAGAEGDDISGT